jgi:bisphosphoglycerate-independent phosphoglycerate mutase (AlkP superfamily)
MYDLETKVPHTAHTLNPVPFIVYDPFHTENKTIRLDQTPENGLGRIAGTVLDLMEVPHQKHFFNSLIIKKSPRS